MTPGIFFSAIHSLMVTAANREAAPRRLWPQPCPGPPLTRGLRSGTSSCDRPGKASYSPMMAITGRPCPQVAVNAVGMAATFSVTANPAERNSDFRSRRCAAPANHHEILGLLSEMQACLVEVLNL